VAAVVAARHPAPSLPLASSRSTSAAPPQPLQFSPGRFNVDILSRSQAMGLIIQQLTTHAEGGS